MTDLNPIIADRFTEHLEVFGKTMEHMDTIQEIAYEHGFASQAQFSKFFRKQMGQTPSEWRRS